MFGRSLTQILGPLGFDWGGQMFVPAQQPGRGPPVIHDVPVGHCQVIRIGIVEWWYGMTYAYACRGAEWFVCCALHADSANTCASSGPRSTLYSFSQVWKRTTRVNSSYRFEALSATGYARCQVRTDSTTAGRIGTGASRSRARSTVINV